MNIHDDIRRLRRRNAPDNLSGFSEATYSLHGVEIGVNAWMIPLHSGVKHQLAEGNTFIDTINFFALSETMITLSS